MDPRLAAIAAQNGGVFQRRDAVALGMTAEQIRHRLGRSWDVVAPGIYAPAATRSTAAQHALGVTAGRLRFPDGVGWLHTAGHVLGLRALPAGSRPVQLLRQPGHGRRPQHRDWIDVGIAQFDPGHIVWRHGVPITTAARTVADLLRSLPTHDAISLADAALHDERTHYAAVLDILERCDRWPGVQAARRLLDFADPLAETPLESISRWEFAVAGLPAPKLQVWRRDVQGRWHRVDFWWEEFQTIGEADGMVKYTDPTVLRAEKRRQEALERTGDKIVRWGWDDITHHADETVRRILETFARPAWSRSA